MSGCQTCPVDDAFLPSQGTHQASRKFKSCVPVEAFLSRGYVDVGIASLSNSSLGVCKFQPLWLRPIWWRVGPFRHIRKVTPLGVSCRSSGNSRFLSYEHWCWGPSQYKPGLAQAAFLPARQLSKHISSAYSRWSLSILQGASAETCWLQRQRIG